MQLKYFSQFYGISAAEEEEWFDPRMNLDTLLFIDPFLVFETDIPIFINAQEKFFDFFNAAFELAHEAIKSRTARKKLEGVLKFPEVKELCLGFSKDGISGSALGGGYSKGFADALIKLASAGYRGLDHFEEIEIFTVGIGKDRISDATANIIKPELIAYTQQICNQFNIPTAYHVVENSEFNFRFKRWTKGQTFSLPRNPFPKEDLAIILTPKSFLCATHAIGSEGFEDYIKSNKSEELRADLNYEIEKNFKEFSKSLIVSFAEKHPNWIREYISYIENEAEIKPYDLEIDSKNLYRNEKKAFSFVIANPIDLSVSNEQDFITFLKLILDQFKKFVELYGGYKLLWDVSPEKQARNEFTARSLFADVVSGYCQINNIQVFRESDIGGEIVEFTFPSKYKNRAFIELKLARNSRLTKGELEKLPAYIRSHHAEHRYYVVMPYTQKEIERINQALITIDSIDFGELQFNFIIVDAALPESDISAPSSESKLMSNDRLRAVERNLESLRKQIEGKEEAKSLAPFDDKARIELGIQKLREEMRPYEEEYWQLLAARSVQAEVSEAEAEVVVAELVEQVGQLQVDKRYPDEVLALLQQIYVEVSKPGTPAAAKLKGVVSMFPPFVSLGYEAEIDTENFFRTYFPTFTKWYKALARR